MAYFAPSDLSSSSTAASRLRADAIGQDLYRHMTIAEMPGEPRQRGNVCGARFDQRLGRGHDFHQPAVVKQQQVVGAQARRLMQIDFEGAALDAGDRDFLRAVALGVVEDNRIDQRTVAAFGGGKDAGGARCEPKRVPPTSSNATAVRHQSRWPGHGPPSSFALRLRSPLSRRLLGILALIIAISQPSERQATEISERADGEHFPRIADEQRKE